MALEFTATATPPTEGGMTQSTQRLQVSLPQMLLMYRGFDPGPIDGEMGNKTRNASGQSKGEAGGSATVDLDSATLAALRVA